MKLVLWINHDIGGHRTKEWNVDKLGESILVFVSNKDIHGISNI
jgi:hypothetical protein